MICLFGGTFDPIHLGHVHAAGAVCDALDVDEVRMLLSARPGHRGATGATARQRWDMLVLACAADRRLAADDTELRRAERRGRASYTVETLEEVRTGAPDEALVWVIGSDAYRDLESWHRWREVFDLADLLVLRRPGAELSLAGALEAETRQRLVERITAPAGQVRVLEAPMLNISASAVRDSLAAGGTAAADLLPRAVYTYIYEHHLYGVIGDV